MWGYVRDDAFIQPLQRLKQIVYDDGEFSDLIATTSTVSITDSVELTIRRRDGRPTAVAEFSVPTWLRGENTSPATVAEVRAVVSEFYDLAAEHVKWKCGPDELGLARLDIARDFGGVLYPGELLERLSHVPASRCTTRLYRTEDCAGTQTLYRETQRWKTRLYERGHQYAEKAAVHVSERPRWSALLDRERNKVRYEVELRAEALKRADLLTIADLEPDLLWEQAAKYFKRSRFDVAVGGGTTSLLGAVTRALAREDGQIKHLGSVLLQVWLDSVRAAPVVSHNTAARYRRLASTWNISATDLVQDDDHPRVRLDLDAGWLKPAEGLLARDDEVPF